jgi:hypothetical protein
MTKAERRAEKLWYQHRWQRRQRLKAEVRRNQAEREAEQAAARAGPPPWLSTIRAQTVGAVNGCPGAGLEVPMRGRGPPLPTLGTHGNWE